MLAAGRAAQLGAHAILLEKMERTGKKLLVSGNGRCNLTNAGSLDDFIPMYGKNGRFLHRAFEHFFRDDLLLLLDEFGVKTITGENGRIFPKSENSADVRKALMEYLLQQNVEIITGAKVLSIEQKDGTVTCVQTPLDTYQADAVVLATGGVSYPQTGSTGDGYRLAGRLGHTIVDLKPALVPLIVREQEQISQLQGISLKKVRITSYTCEVKDITSHPIPTTDFGRGIAGKSPRAPLIESRTGDIVFAHYGISGPAVLLMSLAIARALERTPVSMSIDIIPDRNIGQLDSYFQAVCANSGSRQMRTVLAGLAPGKVIELILKATSINPGKLANQLDAAERKRLVNGLKNLRFNIEGTRPIAEAMVTSGGVCLNEVNPLTMESKLVKGLYFCGEVLDIDAETGGFNLQAAFSTGYLAGESAALSN